MRLQLMSVLLRALIAWLFIFLAAEARNLLFAFPRLDLLGHVLRTVILCASILIIAWVTVPWITPDTKNAWAIGLLWLGLIVSFEFAIGGYRRGHRMIRPFTYNDVRLPGLWLFVLVTALLAPALVTVARQH